MRIGDVLVVGLLGGELVQLGDDGDFFFDLLLDLGDELGDLEWSVMFCVAGGRISQRARGVE